MRLLADTHILIWYAEDSGRLPLRVRAAINEPENELFFSLESLREIAIKSALNRSNFAIAAERLYAGLIRNRWNELAVTTAHIFALAQLPQHHRDPFDRMLIAQARVEAMTVLSVDSVFGRYPVPVIGR